MTDGDYVNIIAGPCSVNENSIDEIEEILSIEVNGRRVVNGTRIVGLKSRTFYNSDGDGMGMDFEVFNHNLRLLMEGRSFDELEDLPSVTMAKKIQDKFNCIVATEVVNPYIQMPLFSRQLKGPVLLWNSTVNQLGWSILHMSKYCEKNKNWLLGFKNPKNLGISVKDSEENNCSAPMERSWIGLTTYSQLPNERKILIHRGIDSEVKSLFRSDPVHKTAMRTKMNVNGIKLFFDPSHSFGPQLRDEIVDGTVEAMKIKDLNGDFLYDGILVECGTSSTDTKQHITVKELKQLAEKISEFREF
ncbi:MAG: hypothetical protein IJ853_03490 [Rickettsiales bacterium]|nr:hypothetical protein [Rickettsiales bacterium]